MSVCSASTCLVRAKMARALAARRLHTLKLLLILGLLLCSLLECSDLLLQARFLPLGLHQRLRCCGVCLGCGLGSSRMLLLQGSQRCCDLGLLGQERCKLCGQVINLSKHVCP